MLATAALDPSRDLREPIAVEYGQLAKLRHRRHEPHAGQGELGDLQLRDRVELATRGPRQGIRDDELVEKRQLRLDHRVDRRHQLVPLQRAGATWRTRRIVACANSARSAAAVMVAGWRRSSSTKPPRQPTYARAIAFAPAPNNSALWSPSNATAAVRSAMVFGSASIAARSAAHLPRGSPCAWNQSPSTMRAVGSSDAATPRRSLPRARRSERSSPSFHRISVSPRRSHRPSITNDTRQASPCRDQVALHPQAGRVHVRNLGPAHALCRRRAYPVR